MSRRRILAAIEGPCRGEGCAKLLTPRIVVICSQGIYVGRPAPASGLAASIFCGLPQGASGAYRCDCGGGADTNNSGANITFYRINISELLMITVNDYLNIVLLSFFAV
jgi:hypothetical protein